MRGSESRCRERLPGRVTLIASFTGKDYIASQSRSLARNLFNTVMRSIAPLSFFITIIFLLALPGVRLAHAHGEEPRLEVSPERLNPGGVVDVRGAGFEPEERIALTLMGAGFELAVGEMNADQEGIFLQIVSLPEDLAQGAYYFRAVTDDHEIFSPAMTVFGQAVLEGEGGQGQRDEEDLLLAPMPTSAPAAVPTAISNAESVASRSQAESPNARLALLLGFVMLLTGSVVLIRFKLGRTG